MKLASPLLIALLICVVWGTALPAAEKWPGIDDAVVNKIAREHGRAERPSLFPTAEGDLQLFLFLLAGTVGGFAAGYYWRVLLEGKNNPKKHLKQGDTENTE